MYFFKRLITDCVSANLFLRSIILIAWLDTLSREKGSPAELEVENPFVTTD